MSGTPKQPRILPVLQLFFSFSHSQFLPLDHPCTLPSKQPTSACPFLPGSSLAFLFGVEKGKSDDHLYTHINSCQNRALLQRDFGKLWDSVSRNLIKFYNKNWSVLHQGQNKPTNEGRLRPEELRSDPEEQGLAMKRNATKASSTCQN